MVGAEKIRFFKGNVQSKMKFHVTVGHTTVMATAQFFGEAPAEGASSAATVAGAERLLAGRGLHSLTSQLNLTMFGNTSLTLELDLSSFGTHPRTTD